MLLFSCNSSNSPFFIFKNYVQSENERSSATIPWRSTRPTNSLLPWAASDKCSLPKRSASRASSSSTGHCPAQPDRYLQASSTTSPLSPRSWYSSDSSSLPVSSATARLQVQCSKRSCIRWRTRRRSHWCFSFPVTPQIRCYLVCHQSSSLYQIFRK